jgi:hypothetical protein
MAKRRGMELHTPIEVQVIYIIEKFNGKKPKFTRHEFSTNDDKYVDEDRYTNFETYVDYEINDELNTIETNHGKGLALTEEYFLELKTQMNDE